MPTYARGGRLGQIGELDADFGQINSLGIPNIGLWDAQSRRRTRRQVEALSAAQAHSSAPARERLKPMHQARLGARREPRSTRRQFAAAARAACTSAL